MDEPRKSEREREISHSNTHIWNLEKMVLKNLFTGQQWRNRYREQTYEHRERGGKGEMYGKNNMETYITISSQWEFAVWLRKLKQGLCINLEGWNGEGDGREAPKGGDICISSVQSLSHVQLFVTPWTAARQASLSITTSQSSLIREQ